MKITAAIGYGIVMAMFLSPFSPAAPLPSDQLKAVAIVGGLLINSAWWAGIILWALRWRARRRGQTEP